MEHLKRGVTISDKIVFNLESIFLRHLAVGQQREMELTQIFGYELCAVPISLMDEYGCFRKGNKAIQVHKFGVKHQRLHALCPHRERPAAVVSRGLTLGNCECGWRSH